MLSNRTTVSVKQLIAEAETNMTIYTGRRIISLSISEGRSRTPIIGWSCAAPCQQARATSVTDMLSLCTSKPTKAL